MDSLSITPARVSFRLWFSSVSAIPEPVINTATFKNIRLRGGFVVVSVEIVSEPMVDALGREAIAKTGIVGMKFNLLVRAGLDERELSVTLYHEILEAAAAASADPPASERDFNEADFERTAYAMHETLVEASPENLNRMLQLHGFGEE